MEIIVYSLEMCPNCDDFKEKLNKKGLHFTELDLDSDDVKINLLIDSVTLVEAPIIRIDGKYMNSHEASRMIDAC
ncbi:MAG: glutaredoxin domain-containing protein [Dehalococcoidales bacterium]|jgi:glutaredoxin